MSRQSLREIWESAEAERLRSALDRDDLSEGCQFCEWQIRDVGTSAVFARNFDQLRPSTGTRATWPSMMEFSLSNRCNLQCVMCSGELSSTIRAKRDGLPPLPQIYGEEFFEQLAEFLPHLVEARFLGGEPFLAPEALRVLNMLAAMDRPPAVTITTNGTLFNTKIASILDRLDASIVLSIDGASAATFESIRVGASFTQVMDNLEQFISLLGPSKVSLTHCLMTTNWSEFPDLLELAERKKLHVGVNVVQFPPEYSLYHSSAEALRPIVETLRATPVSFTESRASTWHEQLETLTHRLAIIESSTAAESPRGLPRYSLPFAAVTTPGPVSELPPLRGVDEALIRVDRDGTLFVKRVEGDVRVDLSALDGQPLALLAERLVPVFGPLGRWPKATSQPTSEDCPIWESPRVLSGDPQVELMMLAERDPEGRLLGAHIRIRTREGAAGSATR